MFDWFKKKKNGLELATIEERNVLLAKCHPVFRQIDTAVHTYIEIAATNPQWTNDQIARELIRLGIEPDSAEECVCFIPLAWAREIIEKLGVEMSPLFRLHNLADNTEQDRPLAHVLVYAWARNLIPLYQNPKRGKIFETILLRSAELDAVNNALHDGGDLRGSKLHPSDVYLHHAQPFLQKK